VDECKSQGGTAIHEVRELVKMKVARNDWKAMKIRVTFKFAKNQFIFADFRLIHIHCFPLGKNIINLSAIDTPSLRHNHTLKIKICLRKYDVGV